MRIKSKASKLISVLLVAVMIVTTVSVSFAETEQISDVTTPAAQEVDVLSASDDSSAKASDANQASDVQASDVQASGTQESGTDATDSTEAADSNVTSTEGETEEDVILSSESDEEAVEEGIALLAEQGYTIKFNRNGGSGTAPADITTDEDGNFTFPGKGSMSRSGYTFMGWGRSTTTGHCDTSDGSIPKNATNYSIYEPGEKGSASRDMKYYAVWARSESAQYFIRLDGTVPREPGDYSTSLYTDQIGTGKTVALNTFYANSNIADNGVASHLGNTPTTAEIMNACNAKASSIIFSDGSRYERCSTTGDFEKKYYVIWYVVKLAGTIHVDGSLLKKSLYNVTYEPNAKAGEYTGTVPATKQYAAGQKVTVEKSNLQREGYTFVGWESSIDGKTYNAGSKFTMPENNVVLKAIWAREGNLSYTVNYLDQSTGDAIADPKVVGDKHYGDEVTETAIDIDGYDKVEPVSETITISKGENVINFYYTKRTDLSYTVNYLEQGTNKVLADAKTVNKQTFNAEITEGAIDIAGYNKVDPTSKTITIGTGSNVINFYYTKRTDLTYTVNYLEYGTNKVLHDPKTVENQVLDSTASESAIDIAGYNKKAPTSVSIKIAADRNIINFYYEKRTDLEYTVNYLEKGTDNVLATAKSVKNQTFGTTVEEEAITINGYNLDSAAKQSIQIGTGTNVINFYYTKRTDLEYTVNYLEKGTNKVLADAKKVGKQTFGAKVEEDAITIDGYTLDSDAKQSIQIGTGTNVINFYYTKRTDLEYTVNYLEKGTNKVLADAKKVGKQTFGAKVEEDAITIDGYTLDSDAKQSIEIGTGTNVINFYYKARTDLSYTVKYMEKNTTTEIATALTVNNQTFGTSVNVSAIDIAGYNKVAPTTGTINITTGTNEHIFYYEKRTNLSYKVKYLEVGTDKVLHDEKTVSGKTYLQTVSEKAETITGYDVVGNGTQQIVISADNNANVITFYYTKKNNLSYIVRYLEKDTNNVLRTPDTEAGQTFGSSVTKEAPDIDGYTKVAPTSVTIEIKDDNSKNEIIFYYTKRTDLSYTVNYLEQGTNAVLADAKTVDNQTFGAKVPVSAIDINGYNKVAPTTAEIEITTGTNEYTFYYTKRTDLSYTVNYLEKDTNKVLEKAKTEGDQTFGDKIDVSAIDIEGYDKVAPTTAEIEITTGTNEHTFYYTKRTDLSYTINYYKNSVRADSKLGDTVTVDKQTYLDEVSLDSDTINARKPSSDYYDGEVSADKIVIKVSGNNFDIVYKKKPEMSIEAAGYEGKYDGAAHSGTVTSSAEKGETVYTYYQIIGAETKKLDSAPSVTDVQRDAEGNVITLHYMVEASNDEYSAPEPAYFDIKITPLQISIFWARNINYDGLVHTFEIGTSKDQTEYGVLEGETLYHNATISGQAAGTYDKVSDYSWCVYKSDEKTDSTVNYDIKIGALLTISKARPDTKLSLDIDSYKGVYDGQEHERLAIFQAPAGIAASTEIQYSRDGKNWTTDVPSIKNVGKETCYVRAYNESFIDDEYPMKEYTLEVTPRNLTIYAEAEYMYDGHEKVLNITADDLVDTDSRDEGLAEGEFLSLENAQIKGTEAGVYTEVSEYSAVVVKLYNKPDADEPALMVDADAAEFELTTDNYNIHVDGKLTITSIAANDPAGKNAKGDSDKGSGNGTKTGDTTPVGILFGLLALAACGGGFAAFGRRKREE